MSPLTPVIAIQAYVINPGMPSGNPNVGQAPQQGQIGLVTGQTSIDDLLTAMDAAWKQRP